MRILPAAILIPTLTLAVAEDLAAESRRVAALRALAGYWASQASSFGGWLGGDDPGYVPVVPPDSSLWSPGTLVLLSEVGGLLPAGSRETFIPGGRVKVLGNERSDVAVLNNLIFGQGEAEEFRLQDLPGVLEALGLLRTKSATLVGEFRTELERSGVERVNVSFPNAQIHRLAPSDLEIYLEDSDSSVTRRLLSEPAMRLITSAVFLKSVQLRLYGGPNSSSLTSVLKELFGADLRSRSDGSLEFDVRGVYVAVQTARFTRVQTEVSEREATETSLIDSTPETRDILARLLAGL